MCAEILAIRLRINKKVKGFKIDDSEVLLSQYADDTSLILDGSKSSLTEAIKELKLFEKFSGLKINANKSEVIWIGSKRFSNEVLCPDLNLQWGGNSFKLLGIHFHVDLQTMSKMNYDKKLVKLKMLINSWNRRLITPIGKISIIKSLLISQFNHIFMTLPNPDAIFIKKLNTVLFEFLWNSKIDKIKRNIVVKEFLEGGLKMLHIESFINSLKLTWIRRLYRTTSKWQVVLKNQVDVHMLANCGIDYIKICLNNFKNTFWTDVFGAWKKICELSKLQTVNEMPLWYNDKIKIGHKSIFFKEWYSKGILFINDIFKNMQDMTFYSHAEFTQIFNTSTGFLQFHGLCNAVRKCISKDNLPTSDLLLPHIPANLKVILKSKKGGKDFYNLLCKNSHKSTGRKKWEEIFDFDDQTWKKIYKLPFVVTQNSKLQWFQYRTNQYILTTNSYLFRAGLVPSPYCPLCKTEIETIQHALWECDMVQNFLNNFTQLLDSITIPFAYNKESFIFGKFNNPKGFHNMIDNQILLIIKYYIYKSRCQEQLLSLNALVRTIKESYNIHKFIANSKDEAYVQRFHSEWRKWNSLLDLQ